MNYFLAKTDPETYSLDDLEREQSTIWDGVTNAQAVRVIREMRPVQRAFRERFGSTFVFLADEFYLRAGLPLPGRRHYGDYPQIEDGVGMVRSFYEEFQKLWRKLERRGLAQPASLHGTILTGTLFAPTTQLKSDTSR